MVRLERARVGADLQRQQDGRIHFEEAVPVEVSADLLQDARTAEKRLPHVLIHDEVDVAKAVLHVHVGEPGMLFGKGNERLGEHLQMRGMHADLPRLRLKDKAAYADDIADVVILLIGGVRLLPHVLAGDVDLQLPVAVGNVRKRRLAHHAAGHEPARDGNFLPFQPGKSFLDGLAVRRHTVARLLIRVMPFGDEFLQFFTADLRLFGEFFFRLLFRQILLLLHTCSRKINRSVRS